jgi:membrane protein YqaA with SNARE-associated domain
MQPARRIYDWASQKAYSPMAPLWLAFIFVLEMFLFLPMDALLMLFCMHNPKRRYLYAMVATLTSLFIGMVGYGIGFLLWDSMGEFLTRYVISKDFLERLVLHYNQHEHLAVFLGGFLPIPFKAITISAGFCKLSITGYLVSLFFSRALRFFLLAEMMQRYGDRVKTFVDRHFGSIVVAFGAKVAMTFAFFWVLGS